MFLSRAVPRQDVWSNPEMLDLFESSYAIHQAVWGFFIGDPDKERDFLYRYDSKNGEPVVYIVSKTKPVSQRGVWIVDSKEYAPVLSKGDILGFSVRVNPVITRSFTNEKTGKSVHKRHDVVMDYKTKCREDGKPFSYEAAMSEAGTQWLVSRSEKHGFSVHVSSLVVEQYERRVFAKPTESGKKKEAVIATMDLTGVLEVTDSEKFLEILYSGIGPAKGFGCGLMLVKRMQG